MARGGAADFKGWMCEGQWPEYGPPYNGPHLDHTPPFNSHADAAYGQGYLNLHFPLAPRLGDNWSHQWMWNALKTIRPNDIVVTNWVPHRCYVDSIYYEVTVRDPELANVRVTPVAVRATVDFANREFIYANNGAPIAAFTNELQQAGITDFSLGVKQPNDNDYGIALLNRQAGVVPSTFGHNLVTRDAQGNPQAGIDNSFGTVLLGYQFAGDQAALDKVARGSFAIYMSAKLIAFEGSSQVG